MRVLIISEPISHEQAFGKVKYSPPYGMTLDVSELNGVDRFTHSAFDYDVTIVHITEPHYNSIGYHDNLPKLTADSKTALEHARTVICLPESSNFQSRSSNAWGMHAYEWLERLGLPLRDNEGTDIKPSQAGRAKPLEQYLSIATRYHQIVTIPSPPSDEVLAVVDDTGIVVGIAHEVLAGSLVVMPPPLLRGEKYLLAMTKLVEVAQYFWEKAARRIAILDAPEWLAQYIIPPAKEVDRQIRSLEEVKAKYDQIAYVLYGTGEDLEVAVKVLLQDIGFTVEHLPRGSNIDLRVVYPPLGLVFAIEVTGTKGVVRKASSKIAQAWKHLSDRKGTPEEAHKLTIIANVEYHLDPRSRPSAPFTSEVTDLLGRHNVLLLTTVQLYEIWKDIALGTRSAEDAISSLHATSGFYKPAA